MIKRRTVLGSALAAAAVSILPKQAFARKITPPFKLFDAHGHFYTNDTARYPFNARGSRYGPEVMIAKAMAYPMTPEVVFREWDLAGIEMGLGVQYNSTYAFDNGYLLDIAKQYPDRILPVVILSPTDPKTPATLERMAKEDRIVGVRFTGMPNKETGQYPFLGDAATGAWEVCDSLGLSITLMPLGEKVPDAMQQVGVLAARYPNVAIVLDHIGFPKAEISPTWGLTPHHVALAQHKNVYYKLTTLLIDQLKDAKVPTDQFMLHMVKTYGADHFVWGTDIGNSEGWVEDFVQDALYSARMLTPEQQKAVFYDTAKALFIPGGRGRSRA